MRNFNINLPEEKLKQQADARPDENEARKEVQPQAQDPPVRRTRSGRQVKKPQRLNL
jgi:hypothetical protein